MEIAREIVPALFSLESGPFMFPCPRCGGRGFHHGFGEDGHDPDWCGVCGGSGEVFDQDAHDRAAANIIAAAIEKARAETIERCARVADAESELMRAEEREGRVRGLDCSYWTGGKNSAKTIAEEVRSLSTPPRAEEP